MRAVLRVAAVGGAVVLDYVVPAGAVGSGCNPLKDGWKTNGAQTSQRYANASGAIPPGCLPGSALGIAKAKALDKTVTLHGVKFAVTGKNGTYGPAVGPLKLAIVLGGQAESASGRCGEHTFAAAECRHSGTTLVCASP
jgi:hypothetical protein